MTDVLIHRCTLRVARRGGWSWGPDPKRMLQEVVSCFPALLARKIEQLFPEAEDREFSASMQIRIPIRMSDLLSEAESPAPPDTSGEPRATASLEEKLDLALRRTFPIERAIETGADRSDGFGIPTQTASPEIPAEQRRNSGAVPRLLAQWHEAGLLESRLAALSNDEIESWHRAVWRRCVDYDEPAPEPDSIIEQQIRVSLNIEESAFVGDDRGTRLRLRLLIATRVAAKMRIPLESPLLLAALNRILPAEPSTAAASIGVSSADLRAPQANLPEKHSPPEVRRQSPREWEVHLACALPFLLSGPLSRLGYFDAVAAVLDAADLSDQAPLFAAALAYKILDPPERGWRRTAASLHAASAFAGLHEHDAVANESLVEFSRQIALHTAPLDWLLTDSLIRGHTPGEPVLLRRADLEDSTGFLLIEVDGCFPIAWTEDVPQLLPILGKLGSSIVLVSREAAGPRVLRELDAAGFCFVTDVPPTRGESWRRIQLGPLPLGWTNHPAPESEPVLQAARDFPALSEDAAALWETLAVARPSVIHARLPHLDRSLTLAAAVAGGMIAWKLWRRRGRTSPQMVVERFCDLDGRVSFDPNSVVVRLPLGRRHHELLENGLLSPVRDIPWLEGRRVEFGGG